MILEAFSGYQFWILLKTIPPGSFISVHGVFVVAVESTPTYSFFFFLSPPLSHVSFGFSLFHFFFFFCQLLSPTFLFSFLFHSFFVWFLSATSNSFLTFSLKHGRKTWEECCVGTICPPLFIYIYIYIYIYYFIFFFFLIFDFFFIFDFLYFF